MGGPHDAGELFPCLIESNEHLNSKKKTREYVQKSS